MFALVLLRCIPRSGKAFRLWFAAKVLRSAAASVLREAQEFHSFMAKTMVHEEQVWYFYNRVAPDMHRNVQPFRLCRCGDAHGRALRNVKRFRNSPDEWQWRWAHYYQQ